VRDGVPAIRSQPLTSASGAHTASPSSFAVSRSLLLLRPNTPPVPVDAALFIVLMISHDVTRSRTEVVMLLASSPHTHDLPTRSLTPTHSLTHQSPLTTTFLQLTHSLTLQLTQGVPTRSLTRKTSEHMLRHVQYLAQAKLLL
jgi:hypothetical protein